MNTSTNKIKNEDMIECNCEIYEDEEDMEIFSDFFQNSDSDDNDSDNDDIRRQKKLKLSIDSDDEGQEIDSKFNNDDTDEHWNKILNDDDLLSMPNIPFSNTNLQKFGEVQEPIEYFKKFFTNELTSKIIQHTNAYANNLIKNKKLTIRSIWNNWKDVTDEEMNAFLGVVLNMGTIPLADIKEYFSNDFTCRIPFFSKVFKRDRFLQIFWMFHLSSNLSSENSLKTEYANIKDFIDYIDLNFRQNFIPNREICVDAAVVPFKGTYNPNKPTKLAIRIYLLTDSHSGYVYSFLPYFGALTSKHLIKSELLINGRIVLHLYNNLLQTIPNSEGYHLYVDKYHTSIPLAKELLKKKCYLTGKITNDRKLLPRRIRKLSFQNKKLLAYRLKTDKNYLTLAWKDKRVITLLSTCDSAVMKTVSSYARRGVQLDIKKPELVLNFNKHMSGVHRPSHCGSMYSCLSNSVKWWRKIFLWALEVSCLNSYVLYKLECEQNDTKPLTQLKFNRKIVMSLVGDYRDGEITKVSRPTTSHDEERLNKKLHILQPDSSGKHNDCLVCSNRKLPGGRKTTIYFCETCNRKPFLHIGNCFKKYHTLKTYKNK